MASAQDYASKMKLWYSSPSGSSATASNWMEYALPIGNGQLGATFIGNVDNEYLQFNEKTLWTGTKDQNNKGVTSESGSYYGSYQNFGYLTIKTGHSSSSYSGYKRELDLSTATGKVSYTSGGVQYTREFIASYPGNVVVARFSANQTGKQNLTISLTKGQGLSSGSVSYSNGTIGLSGNLETVAYGARIKVVNVNGTITTNSSNITVKNADEVYIILAAGTNFDASVASYVSGDANSVLSLADSRIAAAVAQGWDAVYSAHKDDYQALFGRVEFDLTGSTNTSATNSLIGSYSGGTSANDLMLDQLYFAYGRYLEIASSRGVGLPSNLQGIWCNTSPTYSTWNCDIHANINVQMNYWPAEATNLSEMHVPFLEWIINMANSAQWKQYAKNSGQSRGWTTFTENNIFGGVGYWMQNSTVQNAWFCSHLWQHFEYTRDEAFLAKAFPAMLGATQFWLDRLVLASDGTYECPNEYSPEHGPSSENGVAYAQQLVYELFDNTLKAVDVLGTGVISQTDLNDLKNKFAKLDKGLATEKFTASGSYGGFLGIGATKWANYANGVAKNAPLLREWKYSAYNCSGAKVEHRHLSHLMCMYPFSQVDANSGELFTAAKNSLQMRGDAATGWAMGWKINLWARALDGDHAHKILKSALTHSTTYDKNEKKGGVYYNLWSSHAPFQIDGNFGATAGMTEMLLQSHGGVLNILPAIPSQWKNGGSVKGLKGRGNFTVDFNWKSNGTVNNISIVNVKGEKCLVKCAGRDISAVYVAAGGRVVVPVALGNGVYEIPSKAGDTIEIDFNREPGKVESEEPAVAVETPAFSITGGEVEEGTKVTISCATEGATVYYTTDGTEPTTSSAVYSGAITVNKAMTIKAVAAKNGYYTNSEVASASFTIKAREVVKTPVFSIGGGEVEAGTMVTISCATSGATIYYTTDGSTPTTSSAVYSGAITVNIAMTIKAMAAKSGNYLNSSVVTASYTIKAREVVATPVINPAGGEVEAGAGVTISCATSGATIYYTTDGTTPTTSSTVYSSAIAVNNAMTIKAMAAKSGYYTNSAVATATFTIRQTVVEPETPVEPEEPVIDEALQQAIAAAQEVSAYTGVGYPSSSAATRVALDNAIANAQAGNATASDLESAVSAFKNEVSDIQMPEDGVTYKFVNVAKNGTKYYIKYASSGISMVTDESQATEYTCEAIGGDEYVFVASDGKYLIWKGPNGTEGWLFWKKTHGYNSNKGYNSSYNSTYCDLIVEKLTNETNTVSASSNADLFGMMAIQGMRYSRSEYSYFTIKKDGTFDASVTPYYNDTYSSAFYIVATGTAAKGSRIEGTTAVEEVAVERVADDAIYDLTGRKVTEMRAGEIYIQNGKKILKR